MPEPRQGYADRRTAPTRRVGTPAESALVFRAPPEQLAGLATLTDDERDAEVARLAAEGWSPWRIRGALGLEAVDEVGAAIDRHAEREKLTDEQQQVVAMWQLDLALGRALEVLQATHFKFHKGALITMPNPDHPNSREHDVPVIDDGPTLDAAKTVAALLERKTKFKGWDAPERHEHKHELVPLPAPAQAWLDRRREAMTIDGTAG